MKRLVTIGLLAVALLAAAGTIAATLPCYSNLSCYSDLIGFDPDPATPSIQRPLESTQMPAQFGGPSSPVTPPIRQGQPGLAVTG